MSVNHGLLSRKTVSSLGGTFNEGAADTSMDFGRRMLAKFGWKDGQGLGKKEQGMTSHIRAVQRREREQAQGLEVGVPGLDKILEARGGERGSRRCTGSLRTAARARGGPARPRRGRCALCDDQRRQVHACAA